MGGLTRCRFQGQPDRLGNLIITDFARAPRTRLVEKSIDPALRIAAPPLSHRVGIDIERRANLFVFQTSRRRQHNPGTARQLLRRATPASKTFQFLAFSSRQINRYRVPGLLQFFH